MIFKATVTILHEDKDDTVHEFVGVDVSPEQFANSIADDLENELKRSELEQPKSKEIELQVGRTYMTAAGYEVRIAALAFPHRDVFLGTSLKYPNVIRRYCGDGTTMLAQHNIASELESLSVRSAGPVAGPEASVDELVNFGKYTNELVMCHRYFEKNNPPSIQPRIAHEYRTQIGEIVKIGVDPSGWIAHTSCGTIMYNHHGKCVVDGYDLVEEIVKPNLNDLFSKRKPT